MSSTESSETSESLSERCTPRHLNDALICSQYQLRSYTPSGMINTGVRQTQSEEGLPTRQKRRSTRFGIVDPYNEVRSCKIMKVLTLVRMYSPCLSFRMVHASIQPYCCSQSIMSLLRQYSDLPSLNVMLLICWNYILAGSLL